MLGNYVHVNVILVGVLNVAAPKFIIKLLGLYIDFGAVTLAAFTYLY